MPRSTDSDPTLAASASLKKWYQEELFPPPAVELYRITDRYAAECSRQIALDLGLPARMTEAQAIDPVLDQVGVVDRARALVHRSIQNICAYGGGQWDPSGTARLDAAEPLFDRKKLREEGLAADPRMEPAFAMADKVCEQAEAFCKGAIEDNAVRAEVHNDFFINCPIGRQSSELNGGVVRHLLEERAAPVEILELGGGTMSGAMGVLDALAERDLLPRVARYHFSELNPFFVMNARKELPARYPGTGGFEFLFLNFDKPLDKIEPGSIDIAHGVNCLHCAKDMPFTLGQIFGLLASGGQLVVSQFTRADPRTPLPYVDLICDPLASYWDVQLIPNKRPVHGLMSTATWRTLMLEAGFEHVEIFPDEEAGLDWFADGDRRFYLLGSIVARKG